MKTRNILFIVLGIIILNSFLVISAIPTCGDSDGGIQAYTKGKVTGIFTNGNPYDISDSCNVDNTKVSEQYCVDVDGDGTKETPTSQFIDCPEGCSNGECEGLICTSHGREYSPGSEFCPFADESFCKEHLIPFIGTHIFYCNPEGGNKIFSISFDENCDIGTTEWSCPDDKECRMGDCLFKPTCVDSDGGKFKDKKGSVKGIYVNGEEYEDWDICSLDKENVVIESFCIDFEGGKKPQSITMNCDEGKICSEGACINPGDCSLKKCEDCGKGINNLCDKVECESCANELGCEFTPTIFGEPWGVCESSREECKSCFSWIYSKITKNNEKKCNSKTVWGGENWISRKLGIEITQDTWCPVFLVGLGSITLITLLIIILIITKLKKKR